MVRRRLNAPPPPPGKPTPVPNGQGREWMSRDELVPVLPLPLAAFEWIWALAESKARLADQHVYPEEYKRLLGWVTQWGRETAVEVLGREAAPKPVPKRAPTKKKAAKKQTAASAPAPKKKVRLVRNRSAV